MEGETTAFGIKATARVSLMKVMFAQHPPPSLHPYSIKLHKSSHGMLYKCERSMVGNICQRNDNTNFISRYALLRI